MPTSAAGPPADRATPRLGLAEQTNIGRLAAAGFAPRADEQRGYFLTPAQYHATPGTIEVAHTVEPVLIFTPRPGWTGTAHYPNPGGSLDQIELHATLTPVAATVALAGLEQRFGPAADRRTFPGESPSAAGALRLVWVRGGVWLVAFAGPDGNVSITYRRDDRPASSIGP